MMCKKVVLKSEFEATHILSGVQDCTLMDLELYFYTYYFELSDLKK